jgi:hypothetical protein
MVSRQSFVNKIRDLGYAYKRQLKRTQLWRRAGGTQRIFVPLCDRLDDLYVRSTLHQTGLLTSDEIEQFIAAYQVNPS